MTENYAAKRLKVNGIVQGVGFRPFVFQLAEHYGLKGEVANTSSGVSIHIEGLAGQVASFERDLCPKSPPLSYIVEINSQTDTVRNYAGFTIAKSKGESRTSTLISPDVSICSDCLAELPDPDDRRYHYPFINCTNCGPRYTIIDDIPYDRPKTSMRHFKMCAACQAEYDDPNNRRFHAQPNACEVSLDAHLPVCGFVCGHPKRPGLEPDRIAWWCFPELDSFDRFDQRAGREEFFGFQPSAGSHQRRRNCAGAGSGSGRRQQAVDLLGP